jgi:hypothetical protein
VRFWSRSDSASLLRRVLEFDPQQEGSGARRGCVMYAWQNWSRHPPAYSAVGLSPRPTRLRFLHRFSFSQSKEPITEFPFRFHPRDPLLSWLYASTPPGSTTVNPTLGRQFSRAFSQLPCPTTLLLPQPPASMQCAKIVCCAESTWSGKTWAPIPPSSASTTEDKDI